MNPTNRCRENYIERDETQRDVMAGKKNEIILTCPYAKKLQSARLHIFAKLLSARLGKVLSLLTTLLSTFSCNATEHVAKSGDIRQRTKR